MRKLAALSLMLLVLMGTFGTGTAWLLAWQQARREGKARLKASVPATERVVVRLTKAQLDAARVDDHELRLAGRMYDMLRLASGADGTIRLELLPDHAEDRLFAHLDDLVAGLLASKAGTASKQMQVKVGLPPCCLPHLLRLSTPTEERFVWQPANPMPMAAGHPSRVEHPPCM